MNAKATKDKETLLTALKQKKNTVRSFFSQLTFSSLDLSSLVLLGVVFALPVKASSKYVGDWFETEIIIFSQLDDKSKLKEVFNTETLLPNYPSEIDLLSTYLNPDIASLKQQLPSCDTPKYPAPLVTKALTAHYQEVNLLAPEKSLADITAMQLSPLSETDSFEENTPVNANFPTELITDIEASEESKVVESNEDNLLAKTINNEVINTQTPLESFEFIAEQPLTEQQIALVKQANQEFSAVQFSYTNTTTSSENLCAISKAQYQALTIDDNRYSYLGFTVNTMPRTIDAAENLFSETPYLLNKDSLQLNNIAKQLRRSKNFKPLLHMAWRQQVFDPKRSVPLKIFAGDNLNANFQAASAYYQKQKQQVLEQEAIIANILSSNQSTSDKVVITEPNEKEQLVVAKQQRLQSIIEQINSVSDIEQVMAQLEQDITIEANSNNDLISPPKPPVQPWYIDGFLKLHIFENYLNITADFNILNLTLAQQETLQLKSASNSQLINDAVKPIRLQQHRRVISSEIHYFDHPYLGMIIQIRKHKRPKPEVEESTEHEIAAEF